MIEENISLKPYNTFGIDANARYFIQLEQEKQLQNLKKAPLFNSNRLILGGGSNVLLTRDFDGIVVKNNLKGITLVDESDTQVIVKAQAGENWHKLVLFCLEHNWGGVENLSLIPGKVGASPMQNIGAYGVEIKDVFYSLEAWHIEKEQMETFYLSDCNFGYRESIFKNHLKNTYIICSVTYKLHKDIFKTEVNYGAISRTLTQMNITKPTIHDVSKAVIAIRNQKLPNPKEIGNAGSFFKNPIVDKSSLSTLLDKYAHMPYYKLDEQHYKLPAGWLIDQAGWKGKRFGDYGVHNKQALVLVNYGSASGMEIAQLAKEIEEDVKAKFNVDISPEVNYV